MYTLVINDKEYAHPTKLTIRQWMEIVKWDINNKSHYKYIMSVALGVSREEQDLIPDQLAELGIGMLAFVLNPALKPYKKEVNDHSLVKFDEMLFGKFVDLEVYINDGINENFDKIVSLIYDADDVSDWDVADVFGAVIAYNYYRLNLFRQYKNLFDSESTDDDEPQIRSIPRIWYDIIMVIADGQFLNIDKVTDSPTIQCFNWLAWNKDRIRIEKQQLQQ